MHLLCIETKFFDLMYIISTQKVLRQLCPKKTEPAKMGRTGSGQGLLRL